MASKRKANFDFLRVAEDGPTEDKFAKAKGKLVLDLGWKGANKKVTIYGGPFDGCPDDPEVLGVCVRGERVPDRADLRLAIVDYKVPTDDERDVQMVAFAAMAHALHGGEVYVGCMGGMGRTGLMLAIMAKAAGKKDPVQYVRDTYYAHAVETDEQKRYVENFPVRKITSWLYREAWKARLGLR